jgi:hypothetical protein
MPKRGERKIAGAVYTVMTRPSAASLIPKGSIIAGKAG